MSTKTENQKQLVVVRTCSAGVHIGRLQSLKGTECVLIDARRLWCWYGANTLHEVATKGVSETKGTRLSEPVESITLTQAIEVIPVAKSAEKNLTKSRWL